MFRGNMIRWACAVATTVMVVSGCDCPGPNPPVSCTDTSITFETPTADQTVDSPFDVSFTVKNADGTAFNFERAQLSVSGGAAIEATSVSGNRASFTGVPGTAGAQSLVATISQGTCSKSFAPLAITVRDTCSNASVTAVTFPQDTAVPLGVLNAGELPSGTDLQVQVDAMCVSGAQVRIKRNGVEVSPLTAFTNGRATISLPGIPASDSERVDLFAELVRNGAAVNTPTANPQAVASIQVSRALPSCAVTTTGSFGPSDDADSSTPGFQMRVTGTMAQNSTGTLAVTGQTAVPVTPVSGNVSADFTLGTSGMYVATLTCTDASGNTNTATGAFRVDFDPPTVSIVSPSVVDGGVSMTVTQSPLQVQVSTDAEDGSLAQATRNGVPVGPVVMVTNGMVTLPVPFSSDGTFTIGVTVTDTAGNSTTVSFVVTVALSGCGADFARPATCPAFLTPAQMPGGTYSFQTASRTVCANQPVALFRSDLLADGGMSAESPAGNATVAATGLAQFAPLTLTSGDYVFRAAVTNVGVDAGVSEVTCQVTVDLDGPVITSPLVPTGQTVAVLNAAQDTQPGTPGVQRTLSFSARVPIGGRVDVCTTQAVDPVTMASRPTSPDCGTGWFALRQGVISPESGFTFPEGTYDVKIVIVGSGLPMAPASPPVSLVVDGIRPCVTAISRRLPQDTNMDGRLSIAELAGGQPRLEFSLGCGDTSPATLAATSPVVIRDVVGGAVGAVRASTAMASGNTYTVTLTDPYTAEVDLELFVQLTDVASNQNTLAATNDPARFSLRVDPIAPTCNITSPTAALLGIAQVPGGNLDVLIATSADVGTNGVSVTFTGQPARMLTANLSQAQTTYALTGDNTYTIGATCTDAAGNSATATARTTRVDLQAPTCNITAPTNPAVSSVNDVTTTVDVTGLANGDTVTLSSSVAGIMNNVLTVAGTSATGLVRYSNGVQMVTASASDTAGNPCVAPSGGTRTIQLTVNSTSCNLDFASGGAVITNTNGSWINRISAANPSGASPVTLAIGALTSDCGMGRNVYLYQGAPSTTPSGTPQVTNATGAVTFAGTAVSEGQQWTVTIDNGAGVLTHRSFRVSFLMPSIAGIGLQRSAPITTVIPVAPNAPLIFGAAANNQRIDTAVATDLIFGDLDGSMADAQFQLTLTGIDGARVGAANATLDILEDTTSLTPTVTVNATPFTPTLPRMSLQHRIDEVAHTLVIRVTSPSGNVFTSTHSTQVDVIAPIAPTVSQTIASARAATVSLNWMPVYDDASSVASGGLSPNPTAGYDLRWTTELVSPVGIVDSTAFFNSTIVNPEGVVTWSAAAITYPLAVPPINAYYISVRARDEVGNYSPFAVPPRLANRGTEDVLLNPTNVAAQRFGGVMAGPDIRTGVDAGLGFTGGIGSVNNDTIDDLVVSAQNRAVVHDGGFLMPDGGAVAAGTSLANTGAVYVYFGRTGFGPGSTCTLPTCQEIVPYQAQASSFFGFDVSMGNVDTPQNDAAGRLDLLVSSPNYDGNRGRTFLYFGSASGTSIDTSTLVEFRGQDYNSRLGGIAKVVPDLNNDGLNEVLIASRTEPLTGPNIGQGIMYLYFGRTQAQWLALMTNTDPATGKSFVTVNATTASRVIEGPLPVDNNGSASNLWGSTRGIFSPLGDLNADGRPDFVIAANKNNLNRAYLYSGAAVASASAPIPVPGLFVDEADKGTTGVATGFGTRVIGGLNILGSSLPDLIATQARAAGGVPAVAAACYVKVFADGTATGFGAPAVTINGSTTRAFGAWAEALDLNGDGRMDIAVGEGGTVSTSAWVFYQRTAGAFDSASGTGFWQSNFSGPAASRRGSAMASGDFDNDGRVDLAVGDDTDSPGRVIVWH